MVVVDVLPRVLVVTRLPRVRLSDHTLTSMLAYIVLWSRFITFKLVVTILTGRRNLLSKKVFRLIVRDWRST